MNYEPILELYAKMMNGMCQHVHSQKYHDYQKCVFTAEKLKNFPYYCIYKTFSDSEILDSDLCDNCSKNWDYLCDLLKSPQILFLLNEQQKQIMELKKNDYFMRK